MPAAQIYVSSSDAPQVGAIRMELAKRGWDVHLAVFGSTPKVDLGPDSDSVVVSWLPKNPVEAAEFFDWVTKVGSLSTRKVYLTSPNFRPPILTDPDGHTSIIHVNVFDEDQTFAEMFRALHAPWPSWLDLRVRPSLLQRPVGVGWWTDDLIVSCERYEHVVRIGVDSTSVLLPGLSEPHHVTSDRRQLLVANKGADEIIIATLADDMATDISPIRTINGDRLAHPHAARQSNYRVAIADTDNNRVLLSTGQLHSSTEDWYAVTPTKPFTGPCDVQIAGSHILVCDTFNHRIVVFDIHGVEIGEFGQYGEADGEFKYPIAVYSWQNYVLVAEEEGKRLQVLQVTYANGGVQAQTVVSALASHAIRSPYGLSVNRANRLAVVDRDRICVWLVDLEEASRDW